MALSPGFQVTLSDTTQHELRGTLTLPFPHLSVCIGVHNPHTAHSRIFVLVSDRPPLPAYSKHNFLHVPNEGGRWRFGGVANRNNREAPAVRPPVTQIETHAA